MDSYAWMAWFRSVAREASSPMTAASSARHSGKCGASVLAPVRSISSAALANALSAASRAAAPSRRRRARARMPCASASTLPRIERRARSIAVLASDIAEDKSPDNENDSARSRGPIAMSCFSARPNMVWAMRAGFTASIARPARHTQSGAMPAPLQPLHSGATSGQSSGRRSSTGTVDRFAPRGRRGVISDRGVSERRARFTCAPSVRA